MWMMPLHLHVNQKSNYDMLISTHTHIFVYDKCSKISKTFLFLFSNKMLVFRVGIHKILVKKEGREDPDHTVSLV